MTTRDHLDWAQRHGILVPASAVAEILKEAAAEQAPPVRWVRTTRAVEVLGWAERDVRRLHSRCEREQQAGREPKVRVARRGPTNGTLLFDEDGLWAIRRLAGPVLAVAEPVAEDPADPASAIVAGLWQSHYA